MNKVISSILRPIARLIVKDDMEYYLGKVDQLPMAELHSRLLKYGWQPYHRGYVYEGQICQYRRVVDNGRHEYHIRFYRDGTITGHYSLTPEKGFIRHLFGIGSRPMTEEEASELMSQLGIAGAIR